MALGLPAYKQEFDELAAKMPSVSKLHELSPVVRGVTAAPLAQHAMDALSAYEVVMRQWRRDTLEVVYGLRETLRNASATGADEDLVYATTYTIPQMMEIIDDVLEFLTYTRDKSKASVVPPEVSKAADRKFHKYMWKRNRDFANESLRQVLHIREVMQQLSWDHDPEAHERVAQLSTPEDVDAFFAGLAAE